MSNKEQVEKNGGRIFHDVNEYYNDEVNSRIRELTDDEMVALLRDFIDTPTWYALLKYTGIRISMLDNVLRSTNPISDAYSVAKAQGTMSGLSDFESYVIALNATPAEDESMGNNI